MSATDRARVCQRVGVGVGQGKGAEEEGLRRPGWPTLPFAKDQPWMKKVSHSFDQHPSVSATWKGQSWEDRK